MTNEINVKEAKVFIDKGSIVLDVRTKEEYEEGHIKGSINIDIHDPSFEEHIKKLNKPQYCVVYCASGGRSMKAVQTMLGIGFCEVYSMAGGIIGWKKEGMSIEE